jgi:hypothetical protein
MQPGLPNWSVGRASQEKLRSGLNRVDLKLRDAKMRKLRLSAAGIDRGFPMLRRQVVDAVAVAANWGRQVPPPSRPESFRMWT